MFVSKSALAYWLRWLGGRHMSAEEPLLNLLDLLRFFFLSFLFFFLFGLDLLEVGGKSARLRCLLRFLEKVLATMEVNQILILIFVRVTIPADLHLRLPLQLVVPVLAQVR